MANENIKSLSEAQTKIAELKQQIADKETQLKELQNRYPEFVDNPAHILNKPFIPKKDSVLYIPTLDSNRHYAMKFEDLSRNFDQYHYPLYFTDEESCTVFDKIFNVLKDLIKFKVMYEPSDIGTVPNTNYPKWEVYLDSTTNTFMKKQVTNEVLPCVYFANIDIANNCCIWLNYKYGLGVYKRK